MFGRLFGKGKAASGEPPAPLEEKLLIIPIPALVALLLAKHNEKGAELTEAEVLAYRDGAVCMAMPVDVARQVAEKRGYEDIDPENVWAEWQAFRAGQLADDGTDPTS